MLCVIHVNESAAHLGIFSLFSFLANRSNRSLVEVLECLSVYRKEKVSEEGERERAVQLFKEAPRESAVVISTWRVGIGCEGPV